MSPVNFQADDEDEDEQTGDDKSPDDAPAADDTDDTAAEDKPDEAAAPAAPAPAPTKDQEIKDYLGGKYDKASDNSDVKAARDAASDTNTIANIGQALEGVFRAKSMAHGGAGVNTGLYQDIRAQGQQGVAQAQAARQQAIQDFVAKNQLGRQGVEDAQKQQENAVLNAHNDPASPQSRALQASIQKFYPDDDLSVLSANDIKSTWMDAKKVHETIKARKQAAKQTAEWHQSNIDSRIAVNASNKQNAADRADAKAAAGAAKDQGKNYVKMDSEIHGSGRAPPDIKQSLKDQLSIDKANKLFDGRDLNSLSKSEAALVAGELEKIATGGSGTEAGRAGLDPHSFEEQWAAFKNKFVGANGAVEPANIGAFLQQQKDYLQGLKSVTDDRLNKYGRGVHDTYLEAGQITPEQSEKYQTRHPELFPELQAASRPGAAPTARVPTAAPQPPPHGDTVVQGGVTFKWNGAKYVAAPSVAGAQ